jgi:cytosine/creatinine deaminase
MKSTRGRSSRPSKKLDKLVRQVSLLSWYELEILSLVKEFGGFYNAHAHLDRANTLEGVYLQHIGTSPLDASILPLSVKQNLVGDLHRGPAYTEKNLRERFRRNLELQIAFGVTRLDTNIDATPDLPEGGMLAMRVAKEVAAEYADRIAVRIAPTPIFGFKYDPRDAPSRWEVFLRACNEYADYVSALPEKDDLERGFDRNPMLDFKYHIRETLKVSCQKKVESQFHLDQANIPGENGTERLLEVLEVMEMPVVENHTGPTVWIVHMISPSSYDEVRFRRLIDRLLKFNIGVIVCPSAALSMRQLRAVNAPTHNSIARVLELIKARVPIRIGTDNIFDVFVPQGDGDMLTEIKMGGVALRLNSPSIWAKLASGTRLNNVDINTVGRILHEERKANRAVSANGWEPAIE